MLDRKLVVEDKARIEEMLSRRGQSLESLGGTDVWALDAERRKSQQRFEELRHRQRVAGEEIAKLGRAKQDTSALKADMKGVADEIKSLEARLAELEEKLSAVMLVIPNVPDASVPVGPDAQSNVEVRRVGEPRHFGFEAKSHI